MRQQHQEFAIPQPRIIPRPEHQVSRKDISLEALKVLYRLHHAGYLAYLVGGGVRDLLLGKKPKDFDVVTDARPGELRKLFRNSRIIGRRFRLVQVFFRGGNIVEVSTFRRRSEFDETEEGVPARDKTYGTPAEDALRRDLTINALFYNIADFSLVDYVGGLEDLENGRIRVIGDPGVRFVRDPVRMLRVLRHAARTGFAIDPGVWEEIQALGHLIRTCAPARVRDEVLKDFRSGAAGPFFDLMLRSRLFYAIFPAWDSRLDRRGEKRLVSLMGRLDRLVKAGSTLSDSLLWAVFFTPLLEQESRPRGFKELREFIHEKVPEALGGIEFPRQRRDDVALMLALEEIVANLEREKRSIPVRYQRLTAYPEAWLLHQIKESPEEKLLEKCQPLEIPARPPKPRPRRVRKRRRRKGRGGGEKKSEGEG
ncbi:MAG: polynucleotide adenylyltransferase PcnB [Deltaproteobacteria bacterium]|nr:polynucleotide adenylyltransferase PcnB [Deltaproteobacteria bacterium]